MNERQSFKMSERTPNKRLSDTRRQGSFVFTVISLILFALTLTHVAVRLFSGSASALSKVPEQIIYIDSIEWASTNPDFSEMIELGMEDVCRAVTAQDTLWIELNLESGHGNGLERIFDMEARAIVLITVPVIIRYGIDLENGLPEYEADSTTLHLFLPEPEIIGWHMSYAAMPEIEAELRRSLMTSPYELYTSALESVDGRVRTEVEEYSTELLASSRERTEDLLRDRFNELGVSDDVQIEWRR
jgi:hypothetical protein